MTALTYVFTVRDSTQNGLRVAGLAPTFSTFAKLSDNSAVSNPAISEIGGGAYKFSYDAAASGEVCWQVDAGASLSFPSDRYIDGTCTFALQLQPADIATIVADVVAALPSGSGGGATLAQIEAALPSLAQMQAGLPTVAQITAAAEAAMTAQGYTSARAVNLDHLDAAVSTRAAGASLPANFSTMAIDGSGYVTLDAGAVNAIVVAIEAAGIGSGDGGGGGSGPSLAQIEAALPSLAQITAAIPEAMTSQGYTVARAGKLDNLDEAVSTRVAAAALPPNFSLMAIDGAGYVYLDAGSVGSIVSAISASATSPAAIAEAVAAAVPNVAAITGAAEAALTAQGYTSARAATLDHLDVAVSTVEGPTLSEIEALIPAQLTAQGYTSARAANLDHLDAAVSTRVAAAALPANFSTLAIDSGGYVYLDAAAVGAIVTAIEGAGAAGSAPSAATIATAVAAAVPTLAQIEAAIPAAIPAGLTAQGYTVARAGKLDMLDAAVSTRVATAALPANFSTLAIDANGYVYLDGAAIGAVAAAVQAEITAPPSAATIAAAVAGAVPTLAEIETIAPAIATAVLTTPLPESYSVLGVPSSYTLTTMSWDQRQKAYSTSFAGQVVTVLKSDGVTPAHTIAFNDPSNPTSGIQSA